MENFPVFMNQTDEQLTADSASSASPAAEDLAAALLPPLPEEPSAALGEGVIRCHSPRKPLPEMAVLASAKIPYRLEEGPGGWEFHVPLDQEAAARRELLAWRAVNRNWPPKALGAWHETPAAYANAAFWSLWPAVMLLCFFWITTGDFDHSKPGHLAGASDLAKIRNGEWWRCITSLTLHADSSHVLGNAVALWAFGFGVFRSVGGGLGLGCILLSGVFGNLLSAWWRMTDTGLAVGASTATFGALGILVMLQVHRNWQSWNGLLSAWSRSWLPLLAGVALLGFLGTSPEADLRGHLWGFVAGLGLGVLLMPVADKKLAWWVQAPAAVLALALPVVAWQWALAGGI